jgi:hypothetical protein
MKEHKGQNAFNWQLFLGFGFVLIDVFADWLRRDRSSSSSNTVDERRRTQEAAYEIAHIVFV